MGVLGKVVSTAFKVAGTVVVGGIGVISKCGEDALSSFASNHSSELRKEGYYNDVRDSQKHANSMSDVCFTAVKRMWNGKTDEYYESLGDKEYLTAEEKKEYKEYKKYRESRDDLGI